jgi:hypothetical protein
MTKQQEKYLINLGLETLLAHTVSKSKVKKVRKAKWTATRRKKFVTTMKKKWAKKHD